MSEPQARPLARVYLAQQSPATSSAASAAPSTPTPSTPPPRILSPVGAPSRDELAERRGLAPRPGLEAPTLAEHEERLRQRSRVQRDIEMFERKRAQAQRPAERRQIDRSLKRLRAELHNLPTE